MPPSEPGDEYIARIAAHEAEAVSESTTRRPLGNESANPKTLSSRKFGGSINLFGKRRRPSEAPIAEDVGQSKLWHKLKGAVKLRGMLAEHHIESFARNVDKEDELLRSVKSTWVDDSQSIMGLRVGRTQQALVVKLSEDNSMKSVVTKLSQEKGFSCALPLIHPFSQRLMVWQVFLTIMIIFNSKYHDTHSSRATKAANICRHICFTFLLAVMFVPYEIVFKKCAQSPTTDFASDISDAIFIIDIIVQLHLMLVIEERHKDRTLLIDDRRIIAKVRYALLLIRSSSTLLIYNPYIHSSSYDPPQHS
jgi:hypothetical protein